MVDVISRTITPAKEVSFLSDYEVRVALNLTSTSDNIDDMIGMIAGWSSDEIATQCNRSFAKETMSETFRDLNSCCKRLFLSHFPITNVDTITVNGSGLIEGIDFEVDSEAGKIIRLNGFWTEATTVNYTGGYNLPFEAPPALKQAAILMTREGYYAAIRGDASVRSVSHKDSRVMFFDPNAKSNLLGGGSGSPARRAVSDLLQAYMRYEV